jgi:hypothetical protein
MILANHCNTFSSLTLGCWLIILFFKIHFGSKKKEIYEISAINIGSFFVKFSEILTPNIINYETFYNNFYFYLFLQKWRDIMFNQSGQETVFCCIPVP